MSVTRLRLATVVLAALGQMALASCQVRAAKPAQEANQRKSADAAAGTGDAALPEGAIARLGWPKWRNLGQFGASLLFSGDGQSVIVHDHNNLQAVDYETGQVHWQVKDFRWDAAMTPLPGGQLLLGDNVSARIIDIASGKELRRISIDLGYPEDFVSDGRRFAIHQRSGNQKYATVVYDLQTGKELWHHGGLNDNGICYPVGFIPERSELVLRTYNHPDTGIRVLDTNTQKTLREWKLPAGPGWLPGPRLSPDAKLLWAGGDKNVRLWDVATGKEKSSWAGHTDEVIQAAFTADGKRLVTAGNDLTLRWWDLGSGKELGKIAFGKRASRLAVSSDGQRAAAVCSSESTLRRFDLNAGRELPLPDGHTNLIKQLAFLPDGSRLLTASRDGTVRVWDLASKRTVQIWTPEHMSLNWLAVSADGKLAATAGYNDGSIRIYDLTRGEETRSLTLPFETVGGIAFAPTGATLAAGGTSAKVGDDSIRLWNAASGELIKKLPGHSNGTGRLSFTPNGQRLISTASDMSLDLGLARAQIAAQTGSVSAQTPEFAPHIWDLATGRAILLDAESARVVVPAPNGYSIAVIRQNQAAFEFCLLELASGQKRLTFAAEGNIDGPLVFSPDGRLLATPGPYPAGQARRLTGVFLWDTATGKERHRFNAGENWCFAFSPDGRLLATSGLDGTVLLWDMSKVPPEDTATTKVTDDALWADLAADAPRAYRAIITLSRRGEQGVKVLGDRLKPAVPVDPKHLAKLIDDLDDQTFAVRQKATAELIALHDRAAAALKSRLKTTRSAEMRRSIQQLLDKLDGFLTEPELLRQVRAVEALERTNAPAAQRLLEELSQGGRSTHARSNRGAGCTLEELMEAKP